MLLLASRALPVGTKGRLYSACLLSFMVSGSETGSVKEVSVIRLKRTYGRMVRWRCSVWPEDRMSAEERRTRLKIEEYEGMFTG